MCIYNHIYILYIYINIDRRPGDIEKRKNRLSRFDERSNRDEVISTSNTSFIGKFFFFFLRGWTIGGTPSSSLYVSRNRHYSSTGFATHLVLPHPRPLTCQHIRTTKIFEQHVSYKQNEKEKCLSSFSPIISRVFLTHRLPIGVGVLKSRPFSRSTDFSLFTHIFRSISSFLSFRVSYRTQHGLYR